MTLPLCAPGNSDFYIGNPPNMIKMIQPDYAYTNTLDNNPVAHKTIAGGTAVQRSEKMRRHYGLNYTARSQEDADQITSIAYGMLGPGPYYFIDPLWRNVLPGHVSGTGGRDQSTSGLIATVGSVAANIGGLVTPTFGGGIPPGIQGWIGAGNGSALYLGASAAGIPDLVSAPPCQRNLLPIFGSIWVRTNGGTISLSLQVYFTDIFGTTVITPINLATNAGVTALQFVNLSGTLAASAIPSNAAAFGLRLLCNTAAAPEIFFMGASAQYVANPSPAPGWVLGLGVPRVSVQSPVPQAQIGGTRRRSQTLDLIEA